MISHSLNGLVYWPETNHWAQTGNDPKSVFNVFEFGTSLEYEVFKNFTFGIVYRVFLGLNEQIDYRVMAVRSDKSITDYSIRSLGNFNSLTASFGYRFKKIK